MKAKWDAPWGGQFAVAPGLLAINEGALPNLTIWKSTRSLYVYMALTKRFRIGLHGGGLYMFTAAPNGRLTVKRAVR